MEDHIHRFQQLETDPTTKLTAIVCLDCGVGMLIAPETLPTIKETYEFV